MKKKTAASPGNTEPNLHPDDSDMTEETVQTEEFNNDLSNVSQPGQGVHAAATHPKDALNPLLNGGVQHNAAHCPQCNAAKRMNNNPTTNTVAADSDAGEQSNSGERGVYMTPEQQTAKAGRFVYDEDGKPVKFDQVRRKPQEDEDDKDLLRGQKPWREDEDPLTK